MEHVGHQMTHQSKEAGVLWHAAKNIGWSLCPIRCLQVDTARLPPAKRWEYLWGSDRFLRRTRLFCHRCLRLATVVWNPERWTWYEGLPRYPGIQKFSKLVASIMITWGEINSNGLRIQIQEMNSPTIKALKLRGMCVRSNASKSASVFPLCCLSTLS